jgi:hypothetical protein
MNVLYVVDQDLFTGMWGDSLLTEDLMIIRWTSSWRKLKKGRRSICRSS